MLMAGTALVSSTEPGGDGYPPQLRETWCALQPRLGLLRGSTDSGLPTGTLNRLFHQNFSAEGLCIEPSSTDPSDLTAAPLSEGSEGWEVEGAQSEEL